MTAVGPGSWLECIREDSTPKHTLVVGAIYCVAENICTDHAYWECPHCGFIQDGILSLVGFECEPTFDYETQMTTDYAYHICCFKPIDGEKVERTEKQLLEA